MTTIDRDRVEIMLANAANPLTIALGESWLGLLKRIEILEAEKIQMDVDLSYLEDRLIEQGVELNEKERALTDWEHRCGQLEDELRDLQEERGDAPRPRPYGREREVGAW